MRASDLLVKCLENEGVEYVFGVPGEEMLDIVDSLSTSRIQFISTRHEQGAAFMADSYGRLTGRAGVCASTLGPGAMNLTTAVADANLDRSPLVAITGQVGLELTHKEYHQYIDIVQAFNPITKWNTRIDSPQIIPEVVRRAFQAAESEKPGAAHLELPEDVAEMEAYGGPLPRTVPYRPVVREEALWRAAEIINRAEHPIILAGNGVIRSRASMTLRDLVESAGIPVATTFMGKGTVSAESDLHSGTIGLQARDHVICGFDRADLVIAVGYDIVEYAPGRWNSGGDKTIIHIDSVAADVQANYVPAVELVGDISASLDGLRPLLEGRTDGAYYRQLKEFVISEWESHAEDAGPSITPQKIVCDMRRALGRHDILISDVGAHKLWIARLYPAYEPNTVLISNGFASMGFAVPAAIAAKLVHPDRKVLAACGDGGFLMNVQELETAERLGVKVVYLVFNDYGYGLIKWKQMGKYNKAFGVDLGNPDFVKLAESFGAQGYRVNDASELGSILDKAFEGPRSAVIDVPVDYAENFKLSERLGQMICPT
ncbi:MAG: acetolactate synthase large subunit [Armatimonadetes bacterium]|nr:acetolactate synthase large subunit [Armatimonadota bacterium]